MDAQVSGAFGSHSSFLPRIQKFLLNFFFLSVFPCSYTCVVINSEKTRLLKRSALSCPSLMNSTVVSPPEASQIRGVSWMPWRWAQDTAPLFPAPQRPAFARVCINPCKASQKCCPAPFFLSAFILVLPSGRPGVWSAARAEPSSGAGSSQDLAGPSRPHQEPVTPRRATWEAPLLTAK